MPSNQDMLNQLWSDAVGGMEGVKHDGRLFSHAKWGNLNSASAVNLINGPVLEKLNAILNTLAETRDYAQSSWFSLRPGQAGVNWGGVIHDKLVIGVRPEVAVIKEDVADLKVELADVKATLAAILQKVSE